MTLSRTEPAPAKAWAQLVAREGRSLLRLAAPILLIALVNMGMSITDTAMVSALFGAEALASVAVGSDLYSILFYLGAGVLGGLSPFYTAAVVKANPAERMRLERAGRTTVTIGPASIGGALPPCCASGCRLACDGRGGLGSPCVSDWSSARSHWRTGSSTARLAWRQPASP